MLLIEKHWERGLQPASNHLIQMTTQITLSVLYALEVDPPIVVFTHIWTKDEVSSALIPCPLPQDVKPVPNDVLVCGSGSTRPCVTARCSCSTSRLSCSVFCGYHGAEHYCNEQTKSFTLPDKDEDEWTDVPGAHYSLSSSSASE